MLFAVNCYARHETLAFFRETNSRQRGRLGKERDNHLNLKLYRCPFFWPKNQLTPYQLIGLKQGNYC